MVSTSDLVNWGLVRPGDIFTVTPRGAHKSEIRKPLSHKMRSPASILARTPHCCVITLSEVEPGYRILTKVITAFGEIPMRALKVCLCLCEE